MRLRGVGQGVALVDVNVHLPAAHQGKQRIGHLLLHDRVGHMRAQRGAGDVERTGRGKVSDLERRHRPRGVAKAHHQTEGLQAGERTLPGVASDGVIDHGHAASGGEVFHPGDEVVLHVVDGVGIAVVQRQGAFLR